MPRSLPVPSHRPVASRTRLRAPRPALVIAAVLTVTALGTGSATAAPPVDAATVRTGPLPDPRPRSSMEAWAVRLDQNPGPMATTLDVAGADDPASVQAVVNKSRPLPTDYVPAGLVAVDTVQLRSEAADALAGLRAAAAAEGVEFTVISGYRSAQRQGEVYDGWVEQVGQERADQVSARAGYSEHQTGLAVDLGSSTDPDCDLQDCFADTVEGRWLTAHAEDFGFVVRYTEQNQDATGYSPEGWHLRFVGADVIAELDRTGAGSLEDLFGVDGGADYR